MTYLMNMTANEFFWRVFLWIVVAGLVIGVITAIIEKIAEHIERKNEKRRRAYKYYNAPIRPTRRY